MVVSKVIMEIDDTLMTTKSTNKLCSGVKTARRIFLAARVEDLLNPTKTNRVFISSLVVNSMSTRAERNIILALSSDLSELFSP